MVGAFAISAFPLFSGFVSKSMVISAASHDHRAAVTLLLTLASAGTFLHTGLKLPYYMFFGKDTGLRAKEPPLNMLFAMGVAAFLCIAIGVFPGALYSVLPYPVHFEPYTADHVTGALGLLMFTALGFFLLLKKLDPEPTVSVDTDWFYRKAGALFYRVTVDVSNAVNHVSDVLFVKDILGGLIRFAKDGPVWLMHLVATPYWLLAGYGDRQKKEELYQRVRSGSLPLGFAAFFILVYLVVLFFL
jgi:multicomponent Na+:H+ antiporter subunit D